MDRPFTFAQRLQTLIDEKHVTDAELRGLIVDRLGHGFPTAAETAPAEQHRDDKEYAEPITHVSHCFHFLYIIYIILIFLF